MIRTFLVWLLTKLKNKLEESMPDGDTITFDGDLHGEDLPIVSCSCGWGFGPNRLVILVIEAKEHSRTTGHKIVNFTEHIL